MTAFITLNNLPISIDSRVKRSTRSQRTQFGDGYSQVLADGLNAQGQPRPVLNMQMDLSGAHMDLSGSQTDLSGSQTDSSGSQTDLSGSQTDLSGSNPPE